MKELKKYKELMNLYKENREVLNTKCDGLKLCNYLFDIKNNIIGLIEDNKIEELKKDFIYNNSKLDGENIVQLAEDYNFKINARTKGYLLKQDVFMNSETGEGKRAPSQMCFKIVEELQNFLKDKYSNKVEEELNYQLKLLNDKIKVVNDLFKSVL